MFPMSISLWVSFLTLSLIKKRYPSRECRGFPKKKQGAVGATRIYQFENNPLRTKLVKPVLTIDTIRLQNERMLRL